jgi:hypothetical protein
MVTKQRPHRAVATDHKERIMATPLTPVVVQGLSYNHVETLVRTPVVMQALHSNHVETIVSTPVVAQALTSNHVETLVSR